MFLSIGSILSWPSKPRIDLQRAELIFIIGTVATVIALQCRLQKANLAIYLRLQVHQEQVKALNVSD